jgi:N utilization substance protein B
MGRRRKARELALQSLYELELPDKDPAAVIAGQAHRRGSSPDSQAYASCLVDWVRREQAVLDQSIAARLEHWDLSRVALLLYRQAWPPRAARAGSPVPVILDGPELACKYDSEEAASLSTASRSLLWRSGAAEDGRCESAKSIGTVSARRTWKRSTGGQSLLEEIAR